MASPQLYQNNKKLYVNSNINFLNYFEIKYVLLCFNLFILLLFYKFFNNFLISIFPRDNFKISKLNIFNLFYISLI